MYVVASYCYELLIILFLFHLSQLPRFNFESASEWMGGEAEVYSW